MSSMDRFEVAVSDWLDAEAGYHLPDHLEEVFAETAATHQRPAWSSLERWLPVDLTSRASSLAPPRLGRALLIVLLMLALLAIAIAAIGSRQHRVPAPYGPARNGALVTSSDGDIFALDPVTYRGSTLIGGPTFDFGPVFARDGTRFSFLRGAPADCGKTDCGLILMVANADGSGVRALTPGLAALDGLDWSADGTQIAILAAPSDGPGHVLGIVNADGSGLRTLDVGRPVHLPTWLPPGGGEIVFRGEQLSDGDPPVGIFAVRPDGSGLRELSTRPALDENDYSDITVSPDGTRIGYRGDDGPDGLFRAHILDLRTGEDRVLPQPDGAGAFGPLFSPDGRSVVYLRGTARNAVQLVVAPADGSSMGMPIGPKGVIGNGGPTINNFAFSPDGTAVTANDDVAQAALLVPIDGSPASVLMRGELAFPAFQRLAP